MRVLVIGLGSMGRRRVRNLLHLGAVDVAAFEPQPERREAAAQEYGLLTFETLEASLEWRPHALVISTPPDHHHGYAMLAAENGLHFFMEASVVPGRTPELIEAVGGQPILAAPSCTLRFHPGIQRIRRRIADGAIGRPLMAVHHVGQHLADWHPWEDYRSFYVARSETGPVRELVVYELNWMSHLFGRVVAIEGVCRKVSSLEVEVDDLAAARVDFESGIQATLVVDVVSRPAIRRARVVGEEGTLVWDFGAREVREWSLGAGEWVVYPDPPAVEGPGGSWVAENMYIEEMRAFIDALRGGKDLYPFSLEEDEHLLEALAGLEKSSREGRRIALSGSA